MQPEVFLTAAPGRLVPIEGHHPVHGHWRHVAFVPATLPLQTPSLTASTFNVVARARAALASLDASARRLPQPALLRRSTLRREAQSTSELEGTFAPLEEVLAADEDDEPDDDALSEVLNYVTAAEHAFAWVSEGRPVTVGLVEDLQGRLLRGTPGAAAAGSVRTTQVAIGSRAGARVEDARFVPPPPGSELAHSVRDLVDWMGASRDHDLDPVVAAGMAHYQFEALHPFSDGNGRIGRLLVVVQLMTAGVLTEPSLTISPWFEARRADYYDRLLSVSTSADWNSWIAFFAAGLESSAVSTARLLMELVALQDDLKQRIRSAGFRAGTATDVVDVALARPIFSVRHLQRELHVSYPRANSLVRDLVEAGILRQHGGGSYDRRFTVPQVLAVLLRAP